MNQSLGNIILTILALLVIIIFVGALYSFVLVIFTFIFSSGKSDVVKQAGSIARYTIIGLVLFTLFLLIIPSVLSYLNVTMYDMYSVRSVLDRAGQLIQYVTGY